MKRTITVLLSVLLVLAAMMMPVLAADNTAALTDATAQADSTATLTLSLNGLEKGNTLGVEITPEAGLTFVPGSSKWLIKGAISDIGASKAVWAAADNAKTDLNTDIMQLTFAVPAGTAKTAYKVTCVVTVKNDSELVGTYTATATVTPSSTIQVEVKEDVPPVKVELPVQELLTQEEKKLVEAGTDVSVKLEVENIDEQVTVEEKKLIEETLTKQDGEAKVAVYLNIDLVKQVGDAAPVEIKETNKKIRITVDIPADILAENRSFYVVRIHDGKVDILPDLDEDPKTVTFETDRFSTYGLAYEAKKPSDTPAMGDEADLLLWIGMLAVSVAAMVLLLVKKKSHK